jgi:putative chitinase
MTKGQMKIEQLVKLVEVPANANLASVLFGLETAGDKAGLTQPHRLVQYLAQLSHESGGFKHDREVWGPSPAQKRYDIRTDLGNTAALDGDGFKFRGRTGIQITGLHNVRAFRDWCTDQGLMPPDFVSDPDKLNNDPWEGLGPIWFWQKNGLNRYADSGNIEMVTRRINGGLNGYQDRCDRYVRIALVALSYRPADLRKFQSEHGLTVDGIAGPITRMVLHVALTKLPQVRFANPGPPDIFPAEPEKQVTPEATGSTWTQLCFDFVNVIRTKMGS